MGSALIGAAILAIFAKSLHALILRARRSDAFKNVIVSDDRGTTEIDVIVVRTAGIFVVEIKDYNAWIFGNEQDEKWTACYADRSKHSFQNPLRQNFRHIKALQARIGLPIEAFHSIVAFTGHCDLKTPMSANVIAGDYWDYIESIQGARLSEVDIERIRNALNDLKEASTGEALETHVADLKERFSSTTKCPKCGSRLVERRSRRATTGTPAFLGCQAYPKCRYTRQLEAQRPQNIISSLISFFRDR